MLLAKDLMTKVDATIPEDLTINELVKTLREKRIGGLPVVNKDGKICGIVTVGDIFNAVSIVRNMHLKKPFWLSLFQSNKQAIKVKEVYARKFVSVIPETPVEEVVELMLKHNLHTIPVMSQDQKTFCGVVGRHDVTWAVFGEMEGKLLPSSSVKAAS
jgi:CBS domain-containing protein